MLERWCTLHFFFFCLLFVSSSSFSLEEQNKKKKIRNTKSDLIIFSLGTAYMLCFFIACPQWKERKKIILSDLFLHGA